MSQNPTAPGAYTRAQRFLTDDVKAPIEGVLAVDPDVEIWFNDAHGRSMNVFFARAQSRSRFSRAREKSLTKTT